MFGFTWMEIHGAFTHFPIALLLAAAAFEVGAAVLRKPEWRVVSFWTLVVAVLGAIPALISGWLTGDKLYGGAAAAPDVFVRHRLMAFVTSGLALLALLWRIKVRDQMTGRSLAVCALLLAVAAGISGYVGYLGGLMVFGSGSDTTAAAPTPAPSTVPAPAVPPQQIVLGQKLYSQNHCDGCHIMNGKGAKMGPDLTHEGLRRPDIVWQVAHLKDPAKMRQGSTMPPYADLKPDQLEALAGYLVTRR